MTTTYAIDDGDGNALTQGLSGANVIQVAQRLANERGTSVYYYEMRTLGEGEDPADVDDADYTEVEPGRAESPDGRDATAKATHTCESDCLSDVEGAQDVDVTVTDGDWTLDVETTVAPDRINGGYAPCGDAPDCWVESRSLAALRARYTDTEAMRRVLGTLSGAACAYAEKHAG